MRRYLVVPSDFSPDNIPPKELEKLHREGPNEHNADIVAIEQGVEKARYTYRAILHNKHNAKIPEVPVTTYEGGEPETEVLGKPEVPDLPKGIPPIYTFLYRKCDWGDGVKGFDILEMIRELGYFDGFDVSEDEIKSKMMDMRDDDLLTYVSDTDNWYSGPKKLSSVYEFSDRDGYSIESGPYPVVSLIRDSLSNGSLKEWRLVEFLYDDWGYVDSRSEARFWIDQCEDNRLIERVNGDTIRPYESIEKI